ncbi:uncharacterized protein At2g39795, mitochondrial [Cornus florida]|uniref:uncharacterized protein At2g39795, mitochondrial n=1 Tax=Cornus florida TaxID=4283 RepID=UPI00289DB86D|nr:uncharacterized protein At2g39795, mitochondrial [Cornus florida]
MAISRFLQPHSGSLFSSCKTLIPQFQQQFSRQTNKTISCLLAQTRTHTSQTLQKSPFESKILRILRNEIQYQSDYAPPHQPDVKFNAFMVKDRPGEQWITLTSKFGEGENIKIEATMFDGSKLVPKSGDDDAEEDVCLHISLLVDISKGEGCDKLEFCCSAWADCLEIQKVYVFRSDGSLPKPYMGPNFRDMDYKLRIALVEYLKERGVNDDLCVFLHDFMMNKDRIEFISWLNKVESYLEK